jgi:hypothetical protein
MSIKYSVCITYFFNRKNIFDLLNCIDLDINKNVEIIVRNDNPNHQLSLNKHPRIKVFNNKKKPLGEIGSIKFLLSKASGQYVSLIADDDLMSDKIFDILENDPVEKDAYLFISTKNKKTFLNKNILTFKNSAEYFLNFFMGNIFLCGMTGTVFNKNFLIKKMSKIKIKYYLLDTYLLFMIIQNSHKIYDFIYGFNNTRTSRISSSKINIPLFESDYFYLLSKIKNTKLQMRYIFFTIKEFYSLLFRGEKNKFSVFFMFIKNHLILINLNLLNKFLLIQYSLYFFIKLLIKKVKFS